MINHINSFDDTFLSFTQSFKSACDTQNYVILQRDFSVREGRAIYSDSFLRVENIILDCSKSMMMVICEECLITDCSISRNLILIFIPNFSLVNDIEMIRGLIFYHINNHLFCCFLYQELEFRFKQIQSTFVFWGLFKFLQREIGELLFFIMAKLSLSLNLLLTYFPYIVSQG